MSDPTKRITDWGDADLQVTPPNVQATPEPKSVRYEADRVIAYLDDRGKLADPKTATFVRVWTKNGIKLARLKP